jgi:hypothetical protein
MNDVFPALAKNPLAAFASAEADYSGLICPGRVLHVMNGTTLVEPHRNYTGN